jgi:chromosome segregation ATPase
MSQLDLAEERLAQALEKLEKAIETRAQRETVADVPAVPDLQPTVDAMAEERERLLARIAQLEEELAAVSSASQEVEGRLDGAIGEIRAALAR